MVKNLILSLVVSTTSIYNISAQQNIEIKKIFAEMISHNRQIKTLTLNMENKVRIDGELKKKTLELKMKLHPKSIYFKQVSDTEVEGLFLESAHKEQLTVATIGFPWVKLTLPLHSEKVRAGNHHSIVDAGFGYFVSLIEFYIQKNPEQFYANCFYLGDITYNGKLCYKVEFRSPAYKLTTYKVKEGETLPKIANALHVNDYKIRELNPQVKSYLNIKPGTLLIVPNYYSLRTLIYIDKKTCLPYYFENYDEKGLYSIYSFKNVVINPPLKDIDFSEKNPAYHF